MVEGGIPRSVRKPRHGPHDMVVGIDESDRRCIGVDRVGEDGERRLVADRDVLQQCCGQVLGDPQDPPGLARDRGLLRRRLVDADRRKADGAVGVGRAQADGRRVGGSGNALVELVQHGGRRGIAGDDIALDRAGAVCTEDDRAGLIGDQHVVVVLTETGCRAPGAIHPRGIGRHHDVKEGLIPGAVIGDGTGEIAEKGIEGGMHRGDAALVLRPVHVHRHAGKGHDHEPGAGHIEQEGRQADKEGKRA